MTPGSADADATIVITTKNRKEDLRKAIASALIQDAGPRVLVMDDGSTDGTSEMVKSEFPQVRLDRAESSRGYIVQRNRAARLSTTPFIFSIDDDAVFSSPTIVSQTLAEFSDPRIGAVAIPFIDVNKNNLVRQSAPDGDHIYLTAMFIGTAHALRRNLFLRLGGYREFFFHQGEEEDYCIRMLAAGYVVRLGRADPIHHFESSRRNFRRLDLFGRRNNVLFAWCNAPMPYFPGLLVKTSFAGMRHGFRVGRPLRMVQGLALGYAQILRRWNERRPVDRRAYLLTRRLGRQQTELADIEAQLPQAPEIAPA
jgi:glycosyltransferase involved in cell wall biosynthesis